MGQAGAAAGQLKIAQSAGAAAQPAATTATKAALNFLPLLQHLVAGQAAIMHRLDNIDQQQQLPQQQFPLWDAGPFGFPRWGAAQSRATMKRGMRMGDAGPSPL